ncbi:MAG: ABC transporter permease [Deltaproteobacteria bacterium]|nr:ABC transporter permease [Deltaproteobacteria bacterium]
MNGFFAVYYREMMILRCRFLKMIASMAVSPFLYLIAFGYAMGKSVTIHGHTYMEFLIPGLVAMSSMNRAFVIGSEINISRFYWHIFEEFQAAPISNISYVLGETLGGITRAFLSVGIIIGLGLLFGVMIDYWNIMFWVAVFLNSFVFSSLAVGMAMMVRSHADQAMFTNFVITPMAFLGGTFFPVSRLPVWAQKIILLLPLTHASNAIRAASFGNPVDMFSYVILLGTGLVFFLIAVKVVSMARD